jgi:hypothetical protein
MSYVVKPVGEKYKIYNTSSNQYINMFFSKTDADRIARKMNLGAGFGDWIPDFFNKEFPPVYK